MYSCGIGVFFELQDCGSGKLMLYGGMGADGKPLNDAWVLDLEKPAWSLMYMAHSDLCPPQVYVLLLVIQYASCLEQ